jgi:phosphate-selective porin
VDETELGIEWQPNKNFELVAMYTMATKRAEDFKLQENLQSGNMVRLQAQVNF